MNRDAIVSGISRSYDICVVQTATTETGNRTLTEIETPDRAPRTPSFQCLNRACVKVKVDIISRTQGIQPTLNLKVIQQVISRINQYAEG